jgi:Sec-independent protein translocase protein TatA
MVFGIIIIAIAVIVAVLLNKAKISKIASQVEETIAPAIEEIKEVVQKAEKAAPKNKTIKAASTAVKSVKTKKQK